MMRASLYIHIPFCKSKCAYCDFESYAGRLHRQSEYVNSVIKEAKRASDVYGKFGVPSVFIGGGTPSLLSEAELARLFDALRSAFSFEEGAEITMEANPGTVDKAKLQAMKRAGVNRLSFGAQAAQDGLLKSIGRIHTWQDAADAVRLAQDAGFSNINMDLMYALPGQSAADFVASAERAAALGVQHLSLYSLILEEGTPLWARAERGEVEIPDDEASVGMQKRAMECLSTKGFRRYEISNYALEGFECRHNIRYWTRGDYLGLGCAAHSFMNGERFCNPGFDAYMSGRRHEDAELVDESGAIEETVMLETRMTRGLDINAFSACFGDEKTRALLKNAQPLIAGGFAAVENGRLRLTWEGLNLQTALVVKLLDQL